MTIDWPSTTPVIAIVATASVGAAGVIAPALTRRGDRKHERQLRIRDQRAKAYAAVLTLMHDLPDMARRGADPIESTRESSVLLWLWGSKEVRDLFNKWLIIQHKAYGPNVTDADRNTVDSAAKAVRQRMSDEVQGQ